MGLFSFLNPKNLLPGNGLVPGPKLPGLGGSFNPKDALAQALSSIPQFNRGPGGLPMPGLPPGMGAAHAFAGALPLGAQIQGLIGGLPGGKQLGAAVGAPPAKTAPLPPVPVSPQLTQALMPPPAPAPQAAPAPGYNAGAAYEEWKRGGRRGPRPQGT